MKQYPKIFQDLAKKPSKKMILKMGSSLGSIDSLAIMFKEFYRETHAVIFNILVKEVWLEQKFLYDGVRRNGRGRNGVAIDKCFSYLVKGMAGISQKPITIGHFFVSVPTYFIDFFPKFSDYNPFEDLEYFKYPYKHITLDHLSFVYQCHNRLELLEEAESRHMKIWDFENWAANYALSYRDKKGNQLYEMSRADGFVPYIRKINKQHGRKNKA